MSDKGQDEVKLLTTRTFSGRGWPLPDPDGYNVGDILLWSQTGWSHEHSVHICVLKGVSTKIGNRWGHEHTVDIRKRWLSISTGRFHPRTMKTYCPSCKEMIGEFEFEYASGYGSGGDYTKPVEKGHKCCNAG
jgi:hypothetical protein